MHCALCGDVLQALLRWRALKRWQAARCIFLQQEIYKRDFFPVHILLNSTEQKSLLPSFNEYCGFEVELELLRVSSGLLLKTIPSSELKIVWHLLF